MHDLEMEIISKESELNRLKAQYEQLISIWKPLNREINEYKVGDIVQNLENKIYSYAVISENNTEYSGVMLKYTPEDTISYFKEYSLIKLVCPVEHVVK